MTDWSGHTRLTTEKRHFCTVTKVPLEQWCSSQSMFLTGPCVLSWAIVNSWFSVYCGEFWVWFQECRYIACVLWAWWLCLNERATVVCSILVTYSMCTDFNTYKLWLIMKRWNSTFKGEFGNKYFGTLKCSYRIALTRKLECTHSLKCHFPHTNFAKDF